VSACFVGEALAAAGMEDGSLKVWELLPGRNNSKVVQELQPHAKSINNMCSVGRTVATASSDRNVLLFELVGDVLEQRDKYGHEDAVHGLSLLALGGSDGSGLLASGAGDMDRAVRVFEVAVGI
jgi:WD40 repeat protein